MNGEKEIQDTLIVDEQATKQPYEEKNKLNQKRFVMKMPTKFMNRL